jgi:hypothetical protein
MIPKGLLPHGVVNPFAIMGKPARAAAIARIYPPDPDIHCSCLLPEMSA